MNKFQREKLIPPKAMGKNNEVEEKVVCNSRAQALNKFKIAVDKLLDINCWHHTSKTLQVSAEFRLKDETGRLISGKAKKGHYIQIDIPGPGSKAGNGYDWVHIEEIIDRRNSTAENELVGIRVRACSNPANRNNDTAHFFTDDATSTFIIERRNEIIYSRYFGRNEVINSDTNMPDKIRNSFIGLAAKFGFSEIQWKALVKGFLT